MGESSKAVLGIARVLVSIAVAALMGYMFMNLRAGTEEWTAFLVGVITFVIFYVLLSKMASRGES
ncbi:MAG: hypothetical protein ABIH99_00535 [Candidatus Micrarchaeota archaeon]